jgi:hypothetical protein
MSTGANYVEGAPPMAGDSVILDGAGGPASQKAATADPGLVGSLRDILLLPAYGGSLSVQRDLTLTGSLAQYGQAVTVAAGNTLSAHAYYLGGDLSGAGAVTVFSTPLPDGTIDPGVLQVRTLIGTPVTVSVASLTAGSSSQTTLSVDTTFDGTTLTNNGTITWSSGTITLANSATIQNNYDFSATVSGQRLTGMGTFNNVGRLTAALGAGGTCLIDCDFNNRGGGQWATPLQVSSGTLTLALGTITFTAPASSDNGATLDAAGGLAFTLNAGTSFSGAGTLLVTGVVSAGANVPVAATLDLRAGTLDGPNTWQASGPVVWEAGTVQTGLTANSISLTTAGVKTVNRTLLLLTGSTTWLGGDIALSNATIFNTGTFEVRTDTKMRVAAGICSFQNGSVGDARGTVTKLDGAGTTTFNVNFENTGDLLFNGRAMAFQKLFTQQDGGLTDLAGGSMDLTDDLGLVGTCTLNGGTLRGGGSVTGGLYNADGTVQIGQNASYTTLAVSGDYRQGPGATLEIDASGDESWGQLQVGGRATLNGFLQVQLLGGYAPAQGYQKNFLGATGGLVGGFSPPGPAGWDVLYLGGNFVVVRRQ